MGAAIAAALTLSGVAVAQTEPAPAAASDTRVKSPELALTLAESAFEYRDFTKVIEFLDPWVHPPQILDPEKLQRARELLGISHHLQGRPERAREEFEQVLLSDPDRALDAFVVPPAVIATFEEVREAMRGLLEQRRRAIAEAAESRARPELGGAHPLSILAPFGLSHFLVLDRPAWGSLWLITQVLGLGANVGGYWAARAIMDPDGVVEPPNEASYRAATGLQYVGLGLFLASWAVSAIQGQVLLDEEKARLAEPTPSSSEPAAGSGFSPGALHVPF